MYVWMDGWIEYKPGTFQNLPGVLSQPFYSFLHGAPHEEIAVHNHIVSFACSGSLFQM